MAINTNSFIYGITKNLDDSNTVTYQSNDNGTIAPFAVSKSGGLVTKNMLDVTDSHAAAYDSPSATYAYSRDYTFSLAAAQFTTCDTQIVDTPQIQTNHVAQNGALWFIKNIMTEIYFERTTVANFIPEEISVPVSYRLYPQTYTKDSYLYRKDNLCVKCTGSTYNTRVLGRQDDYVIGFNAPLMSAVGINFYAEILKPQNYVGQFITIRVSLGLAWIPVGYF